MLIQLDFRGRLGRTAGQVIVERIFDVRHVVAEQNDNRRFIHLAEVVHQILDLLIRLLNQRQILLGIRIQRIKLEVYVFRKIVIYRVVAAVILNRDVEQEQRIVGLLLVLVVQVDDLVERGFVADIAAQILGRCIVKRVNVQELIKAHQRICLVACPARAVIRMHANRVVALLLEDGCHGFRVVVHVLQHRIAAGLEERIGIAGQKLVFRVAGAAAEGRDNQLACDGVWLTAQRVHERHDIIGVLQTQITENRQIRKGLVHHGDDVRLYIVCRCGLILLGDRGQNRRCVFLGIVGRRLDKQRIHVDGEVERHAVFAVGGYLTPCTDVEVAAADRGEQHKAGQHDGGQTKASCAGAQLLLRKAQELDGEHPPDQAGDRANDDFKRNRPLETVECFGSRAGGIQIPRNNRFVSDLDGIVVADAENQKDKIEKYNRKTGASGNRTEQKENTVVKQDICPECQLVWPEAFAVRAAVLKNFHHEECRKRRQQEENVREVGREELLTQT